MVHGQIQPAICFCTVHELKQFLQVYMTERKSKSENTIMTQECYMKFEFQSPTKFH